MKVSLWKCTLCTLYMTLSLHRWCIIRTKVLRTPDERSVEAWSDQVEAHKNGTSAGDLTCTCLLEIPDGVVCCISTRKALKKTITNAKVLLP